MPTVEETRRALLLELARVIMTPTEQRLDATVDAVIKCGTLFDDYERAVRDEARAHVREEHFALADAILARPMAGETPDVVLTLERLRLALRRAFL